MVKLGELVRLELSLNNNYGDYINLDVSRKMNTFPNSSSTSLTRKLKSLLSKNYQDLAIEIQS